MAEILGEFLLVLGLSHLASHFEYWGTWSLFTLEVRMIKSLLLGEVHLLCGLLKRPHSYCLQKTDHADRVEFLGGLVLVVV